jgi:hypothetical protein
MSVTNPSCSLRCGNNYGRKKFFTTEPSISKPSITTLDDAECHYTECYCALVVLAAEIFVYLFLLFISIRKLLDYSEKLVWLSTADILF